MYILIIIILILFILNNIKPFECFDKIDKTYKTNENIIKKYGQVEYDINNNDNDDKIFKYQNFDIINYEKKLELSDNINVLNKYNDLTKINNNLPIINYDVEEDKRFIKTNLPSQQDIIYDTRFFQPSDADIYNPTDITKTNYTERKIQDVYENLINKPALNIKKQKENINEVRYGASGLKTFTDLDWEYEDENDGMSYDPRISSLSVF